MTRFHEAFYFCHFLFKVILLKHGSYEAILVMLSDLVIEKGMFFPSSGVHIHFDFVEMVRRSPECAS